MAGIDITNLKALQGLQDVAGGMSKDTTDVTKDTVKSQNAALNDQVKQGAPQKPPAPGSNPQGTNPASPGATGTLNANTKAGLQ